jgi:AraC-like DNA-binding protein
MSDKGGIRERRQRTKNRQYMTDSLCFGMDHPSSGSHAVLRVATIHGLPEVLRELGHDPSQVISELGLEPHLFDSPDNRITLLARGRLLQHCATVSGCQHFGLLVGQRDGLGTLGIVGLLARHAPDVGTAIQRLVRHFHLHAQGVEVRLVVDGGQALFSYAIVENGVHAVDHAGDGAVAVQLNIMRELCGSDFKPISAWFVHPAPKNLAPYRDFFRVRLRFDAATYGLEFSSSWLTRRLPATDEELSKLVMEKVNQLEQKEANSFSESVQRLMQTTLAFDQVDARILASMFGMHVRTYHRRLSLEGKSHQELLDQTRTTLARNLLEYSSKDIAEISELLGYSEPRSFIRAFKRWFGMTPARWRRTL